MIKRFIVLALFTASAFGSGDGWSLTVGNGVGNKTNLLGCSGTAKTCSGIATGAADQNAQIVYIYATCSNFTAGSALTVTWNDATLTVPIPNDATCSNGVVPMLWIEDARPSDIQIYGTGTNAAQILVR